MKKRMIALAFLLFLCCVQALAADSDFEIADGVLIGYHGSGGEIAIPNGVTSIGSNAFYGCSTLTSLIIPDSVVSIGGGFVDDCSSLKSLTFGNGLKKIPDYLFWSGSRPENLTSIILGDGVEEIGQYAFGGFPNLTTVKFGKGLKDIGEKAFTECSGLTSLIIPDSVASIGDGFVDGCSSLKSLTFGNGLKKIPDYLFWRVRRPENLTSIILGDGVEEIGQYAFGGFPNLTTVKFGKGLKDIGEKAFTECSGLNNVTLPNALATIGPCAFEKCSSLTSLIIPESVVSVGVGFLDDCSSLKSLTFGMKKIPDGLFWDINRPENLTSIILGDGVEEIGQYAFGGLSNLSAIKFGKNLKVIGKSAFIDCYSLTSISLPDNFTTIGDYAFAHSGLKYISIPPSVTQVGAPFNNGLNWAPLQAVYYRGSEAQWNRITNISHAVREDIRVYYNTTLPLSGMIEEVDAIITPEQYCLRVVDANGEPLSGAAVTWGAESGTTDNNGQASFNFSENQSPLITVTKNGYFPWDNKSGAWAPNSNRYSVIVLYKADSGGISGGGAGGGGGSSWGGDTPGDSGKTPSDYSLSVANYYGSAVKEALKWPIDLLTKVKTLNLKNDGNLVGDLSLGNFYIRCATTGENAERFELWQGGKKIAQSADGKFDLNVTNFSKGGGCFVRVVGTDGRTEDTRINLAFVENDVQAATGFSVLKDKISVTVSDDVPFLGGSTFNVGDVPLLPVEIKATEDKVYIGFNSKIWSSSDSSSAQTQGKFDKFKKSLQTVTKANATLGKRDTDLMNALMKMEPDFDLPRGRVKINVIGYAEANWGSSAAIGELYIVCKGTTPTFGFTTWVVVVPVTVQVSGSAELKAGAKISYNWESSTLSGEFPLTLTLALDAFGGVGVGKAIGAGAYGSANVALGMQVFLSPFLKSVDLTGDLGIKAYIGPLEYQRSFAHNTWHIYTPDAAKSLSLQSADTENLALYASLYGAAQYQRSNLDYLATESAWKGAAASLLEASARTELLSLLSDTYRNAQPVMTATDNALYAAFVRADADSGARYVVVTKFDGTSWSEPVRADANAVLDTAPALCTDGDTVYLAYARTTENPGDSLLSYALKQEIVLGSVNPDTLSFTEQATFSGIASDASSVSMPQLSAVNGQTLLAWVDSTVSDDNSVLRPASGVVRYAVCSDGAWGNASDMGTVNAPVDSITIGERNAAPAIACLLDEDSGRNLYLLTASGQERIAENVSGSVTYAKLPGADKASFLWNGENVLTSSDGNNAEVPGISGEYTVSGNNIYYSAATEGSANLTVLQYHPESGTWGLPIQLTDENRYLENLSIASLNGADYVLGMHTAATITENAVEDAKNLVWSAVMPVSDLRLDDIDYDAENVKAGESLPVTLAVINAGDHTVNRIAVTLNNSTLKTQECSLKPGESLDIEVAVPVAESLSECLFAVAEPEKDDYSPDNNKGTVKIGYADVAIELEYQQIGTKKALMASVTNQGIEAASGNIVFYDANGSSVAESAFTDLASGDTTIAVYELDESFAGINGGDVSARVTLEQEELYAYNNADTLHIMEAESNPQKTEIVSAVANGERGLSADIACESELAATAYCAFYNSEGKMLSVEVRPLSTGRNSLTFTASDKAASKAKIFVLDNQLIPQCASETVEVT